MDERAADNAAIAAWKAAPEGPRKQAMLGAFLAEKEGLIRQLTHKAARAERTAADMEDLLQAGRIGFTTALKKFDLAKGIAISTYAAWWIRHEVQRAARAAPVVGLPRIRLTNIERARVIEALKDDPHATPEALGVRRGQLEQVKHSIGVRFVSDDTPKGARAIERRLVDGDARAFDPEETIDRARAYRTLDAIVEKVRAGKTAFDLGLPPDAYAAALEIIASEPSRSRSAIMVDGANGTAGAAQHIPARRKPASKAKKQAPGTSYEEALRTVVASKLGLLTLPELEQIAAKLLGARAA